MTQLGTLEKQASTALHALTIDSMIKDLPSHQVIINADASGRDLLELYNKRTNLPGILVEENRKLIGLISRDTFYERTGKIWGTEIYLNRPVKKLLESVPHKPLILPETTLISMAVRKALKRGAGSMYQPLVVQDFNGASSVISSQVLFLAQSQIMINLHKQRLFTVESGSGISEKEAVLKFMDYIKPHKIDPVLCFERNSIRCPRCSRTINYSVIDIVRSHAQISSGVLMEERMGLQVYWMYVRHECMEEIWEIPVLHDSRLAYRSQRSPRLVERYV